jgi:histidyl-tRNA synthetase
VFEISHPELGAQDAIGAGGRYDNLVKDVGGEPLTGVGFAMGDMVMGLVLKKFGKYPMNLGKTPTEILFTVAILTMFSGLSTPSRKDNVSESCRLKLFSNSS